MRLKHKRKLSETDTRYSKHPSVTGMLTHTTETCAGTTFLFWKRTFSKHSTPCSIGTIEGGSPRRFGPCEQAAHRKPPEPLRCGPVGSGSPSGDIIEAGGPATYPMSGATLIVDGGCQPNPSRTCSPGPAARILHHRLQQRRRSGFHRRRVDRRVGLADRLRTGQHHRSDLRGGIALAAPPRSGPLPP